jgi:hypothetical protein
MLYRMKWFFISIFILYWFFLPTEGVQSLDDDTIKNIIPIAYRITILATIIFSVNLLIKTTTKEEVISSVYLLIKPLTLLGVNINTFLIRAYLTLDLVEYLNRELKTRKSKSQKIVPFISAWLKNSMLLEVENISIEKLAYPILVQWLIPAFLIFCYIAIYILN